MTYSNYYGYGFGAPSAIAPSEMSSASVALPVPMDAAPSISPVATPMATTAIPPISPVATPMAMAAIPPIVPLSSPAVSLMPPIESAPQPPLTPTLQPSQTPTIPGVNHGMNDGMRCGVLFVPVGFMPFDLG